MNEFIYVCVKKHKAAVINRLIRYRFNFPGHIHRKLDISWNKQNQNFWYKKVMIICNCFQYKFTSTWMCLYVCVKKHKESGITTLFEKRNRQFKRNLRYIYNVGGILPKWPTPFLDKSCYWNFNFKFSKIVVLFNRLRGSVLIIIEKYGLGSVLAMWKIILTYIYNITGILSKQTKIDFR